MERDGGRVSTRGEAASGSGGESFQRRGRRAEAEAGASVDAVEREGGEDDGGGDKVAGSWANGLLPANNHRRSDP